MVTRTGTYHFVGTRNHAFSNRDMKGTLTVATDWQTIGIAVAIAAVGCIVLALLAWWGLSVWAKRNPGGKVASCMTRKGKEELEIEAFADVKPWKMPAKAAAVPVAAAYKPAANGTVQAQAKETYANGYANGSAGLEASTGAVELSSVRGVQGTAAPVYRGSHNPVIPAGGMDTTYVPPLKPVPIPMVPGAVPDEAAPAADPEEGGGDLGEDRRVTCADRVAVWWNWHGPRMTIALIYLLANAGAFGFGIWSVSALIPFSSVYLPLAKGFGKTLDFNFAFLLFPVMKSLLGYLRGTPIAEVIPLWDAVSLHIFVAVLIVIGSVGHILMHYLNMLWEQKENGVPLVQPAVLTVAGFTGHLVTLLMLVLLVGTLFGRRITKLCCLRIDYSVFLIMHTLWIPVYGVLLIHGPSFWTFVLIPLLFMAAEKALQYRRREVEVEVSAADMVSADVLRLSMRHPGGRKVAFKPGQYIFLADPWVSGSRLEFHPFTISSAPEDDEMTVHIRVRKGFDWASKVKDHLLHVFAADPSAVTGQTYRTILPRLRIDGPYGAPAEDVWKFTHVILVGAGIGVTPFASVLRSISRRYNEHPMNVSFYWVCRDSKELDAFRDLMESTEQALGDGTAIELNVFLTADRDAHKREAVGRRWNLYPGRPSWPAIVKEKAMGSPGADFGVFFCGPIGFARDVERACRIATGYYRKQGSATTFRFYKESF
ncbi:ferric reductase NAD binding domain-containing protein [Hyaloraphidium curvatum]|nr:ferric reductase NAD binding domain-containing protein [Hyaloraphidium curvatum]